MNTSLFIHCVAADALCHKIKSPASLRVKYSHRDIEKWNKDGEKIAKKKIGGGGGVKTGGENWGRIFQLVRPVAAACEIRCEHPVAFNHQSSEAKRKINGKVGEERRRESQAGENFFEMCSGRGAARHAVRVGNVLIGVWKRSPKNSGSAVWVL